MEEIARLETELHELEHAVDEIMNEKALSQTTKKTALSELHIRALQIQYQIKEIKNNQETYKSTK